ncbi:thioredoxin-2-like [Cochliomyia hominivorax]
MSLNIFNKTELEQELEQAGDKLVVIDFYANWCESCKIINPQLEELSHIYADKAVVLKINVDDCEDIAMAYNVTSMPTFVFIKDQNVLDVLVGSNVEKLFKNMEKFAGIEDENVKKNLLTQNLEDIDLDDSTSIVEINYVDVDD